MKVKVSVLIDQNIYKKAHELGINVSKACENNLITLINAIESTNGKTPFLAQVLSVKESDLVRSPGFEPGIISLEGTHLWRGTAEDWIRFREHLALKNYLGGWGKVLFNYAQKYSGDLAKRDLSRVAAAKEGIRPNILKGLAALAKFTGQYEDYRKLLKDYGLRWIGRSKDDIFIDRLTGVSDSEEIWTWIRTLKDARPLLSDLLDFMAVSGLRFVESVNSYNLIVELTKKGALIMDRSDKEYHSGYFNQELSSLEHFWPPFRSTFLRATKKAFVSFVPNELIGKIGEAEPLPGPGAISKMVQKRGLPSRFGDVREAQGTFMTKYLKEAEINFLHGRVTSSVFMTNYFNPSLIVDLKSRAFQGIGEIQEKIRG